MKLGSIFLSSTVPTEAGWYYWQNDILHTRGKFVEVFDMGGRLSYICQNEWVDVGTFKKSKWSERLTFDLHIF